MWWDGYQCIHMDNIHPGRSKPISIDVWISLVLLAGMVTDEWKATHLESLLELISFTTALLVVVAFTYNIFTLSFVLKTKNYLFSFPVLSEGWDHPQGRCQLTSTTKGTVLNIDVILVDNSHVQVHIKWKFSLQTEEPGAWLMIFWAGFMFYFVYWVTLCVPEFWLLLLALHTACFGQVLFPFVT